MKKRIWAFSIPAVILLAVFLVPSLLTSQSKVMYKPSKEDVAHKMKRIQMPFVANNGQVDAQVKFYANTFGGTVFVTKEGEIVYSLPNNSSELGVESLKSDGRRQRSEARIQECRGELNSPSGIPPLERGTHPLFPSREGNGVCNTTPISHDRNETPPRPLPYRSIGQALLEGRSGVALKEQFVGAKARTIQGEEKSVTKVNYFKGNDSSKWKSNISTYDVVNLGEIYKGIDLKLKAYGNNVEKLFCVKPDANPEQIKISLSGIQPSGNPPPLSPSVRGTGACPPLAGAGGGLGASLPVRVRTQTGGLWVNDEGQLVAETELGAVKFTKPVAYQEINGKRVDVSVEYRIQKSELNPKSSIQNFEAEVSNPKSKIANRKLEYGFTVASYDRTKDLIIDPLLASTYLGGSSKIDVGYSLALDTSGTYDTSYNGGALDLFVSKLDGNLIASTATPTPTPTPSPTPSPSPTPTPSGCDGVTKTVETDTGDFELLKQESKVVTVTVTDAGGCPVADKKVFARINRAGKKRIKISSSIETTDENGATAFTITAKKKTVKATVTFKSGGIKKKITANVVSE